MNEDYRWFKSLKNAIERGIEKLLRKFRGRRTESVPMNEDYRWLESLKNAIKSGTENLIARMKEQESRRAEQIKWQAQLRNRMAKIVTGAQKLAIQVVSGLYFIEKAIRAALGSTFASEFLKIYQKLTTHVEGLIEEKLKGVPVPDPFPESLADGTGGLTVAMLLTSADQETVKALLPEGLELSTAEQMGKLKDQMSGGRYPIMIGLGFNSDVRPVWREISFVKMKYLELTIGVPGVQFSRDFPNRPEGPFFYIPALLLNSFTPTLLGWAFGFKKRLKRIKAGASSYQVSRLLSGRPLLAAEVTLDQNNTVQLASNLDDLAPWLGLLDKPIVSRTWWGGLRFTFFHWDWPFTPTSPARVEFSFSSGELPLVPQGTSIFTSLPESEKPGAGPILGKAYLMSVPWRLLLPFGIGVLNGRDECWRSTVGEVKRG